MTDERVSQLPEGLWSAPEADTSAVPELADVEAVLRVRIPARLDYRYTAGEATSRSLLGMAEKRIIGEMCPKFGYVFVPPRGASPNSGLPTTEQVDLPHVGTVTTFCVVNVEFTGQGLEVPYVSANILIDGSHVTTFGLIQEIPPHDVRLGLRVEAVWKDDDELEASFENIKWWRPTGEPDADYESYREYA